MSNSTGLLTFFFPALLVSGIVFAETEFSVAIEDNSFLIEEAYNQEDHVVQHISNAIYSSGKESNFIYSFTQEWPFLSQANQLSFTIPYSFQPSSGVGDLFINYRYQLFDKGDWAAVAPRFSLILPTGQSEAGFHFKGVQFNLPLSKRVSEAVVLHVNTGWTYEKAENSPGDSTYNLGGSMIWLLNPRNNLLFEYVVTMNQAGDSRVEQIISPGYRRAIQVGKLQVVPGIGIPVRFAGSEANAGIFFYLSLEHPF